MKRFILLMGFFAILNTGAAAWGYSESAVLHLDPTYDRELQYEASADKTITPYKVIRWIMGLDGQQSTSAPLPIDFQPIVRAHDGQTQVIAAVAYKF